MYLIHYLAQILVMNDLIIHLLAFPKNLASLFLHHKTQFLKKQHDDNVNFGVHSRIV
jgi:hypothetical protein